MSSNLRPARPSWVKLKPSTLVSRRRNGWSLVARSGQEVLLQPLSTREFRSIDFSVVLPSGVITHYDYDGDVDWFLPEGEPATLPETGTYQIVFDMVEESFRYIAAHDARERRHQ